jgi:uncharacterized protein (TIGR03382 family)
MPNAFPIRHVGGLGAAVAAQLVQSVQIPATTLQLPTPANIAKLSAAGKKSVAIAAGLGGVAAYVLWRRAWVAALGVFGGAVYGMYRAGASPAITTTALPAASTAQFVSTLASQPVPVTPVTAPAPAPPPGAASAPAPSPPPTAPADPSVVSTLDPPELTDDIEG